MNTVNVTESNHFIRLNIEMPTQVYSTHAITIFWCNCITYFERREKPVVLLAVPVQCCLQNMWLVDFDDFCLESKSAQRLLWIVNHQKLMLKMLARRLNKTILIWPFLTSFSYECSGSNSIRKQNPKLEIRRDCRISPCWQLSYR